MDQNNMIQNKYFIQNVIGRGGFADVYQCLDDTGKQFAMKVFKKSKDDHIQNEVKIQSMFQSQYIVRYIESIRKENLSIVLEYCSGGDLQRQLEVQKKQFTEHEVLQLIKFILNAYYELISNGIIHRDLKPANILIHEGQYKLGDFGISKIVKNYEQLIFEKITIGSYQYMSPQLFYGKYTSKCDIWSLGIIIYYCLYQEFPWGDIKGYKNINQYFNIDTRVLKFKNKPKVSEYMKQIVEKCLKYEENDRCSWQELMHHPKLQSFQNQNLQNEEKIIIEKLRKHLYENKINGNKLFGLLTQEFDQPLKMHQFFDLMKQFNPDLIYNEIAQLFYQLDNDKQFRIKIYELKSWLYQNKLIDNDENFDVQHKTDIIQL